MDSNLGGVEGGNSHKLLDSAIAAMTALHESLVPNDNAEQDATVPAAAIRDFVDAHARLLFERKRIGQVGVESDAAGLVLVAHVTIDDETQIVDPKLGNIERAMFALAGQAMPGRRIDASVRFDTMTRAAFEALPEYQ